jgi:hypothetical protein
MSSNNVGHLNNNVYIIIIIIIIRHQLDLGRPVSASSDCLFKGLPSRLRPFGLKFSIIFGRVQFSLVSALIRPILHGQMPSASL